MAGTAAAEILRGLLPYVKGRSALYERIVGGLAGAAERGFDGGVLPRLLATPGPANDNEARMLLLASLHHTALGASPPRFAEWYPTAVAPGSARRPDDGAPGALVLAWLIEHEDEVAAFIGSHRLQTNEVGRCAALLPGFLEAAQFGRPLRLLEIGCSAGLNLRFDRYRYDYLEGPSWGPKGGPTLNSRAEGNVPRSLAPPTLEVAERHGVDLHPIDATDPDSQRLLRSFVWPDDAGRHERLTGAFAIAAATPVRVDQGDAIAWGREHAHPREGVTTVLFHSAVRHLLDDRQREALDGVAETALRAATADAPVVYLQMEPPHGMEKGEPEVQIAVGTGEGPPTRRTLAATDWHGRWLKWW